MGCPKPLSEGQGNRNDLAFGGRGMKKTWSIFTRDIDSCAFFAMAALSKDAELELIKPTHSFFFWYRAVLGMKAKKCKEGGE